jgi:hypothetical protein
VRKRTTKNVWWDVGVVVVIIVITVKKKKSENKTRHAPRRHKRTDPYGPPPPPPLRLLDSPALFEGGARAAWASLPLSCLRLLFAGFRIYANVHDGVKCPKRSE